MTIDYSNDEIVHYFMNDSLLFEPGTDWSYSNAGYFLLGLVVEKISGKSLHEYVQENIFNSLNMNNTFFGTNDKIIPLHVMDIPAVKMNLNLLSTPVGNGHTLQVILLPVSMIS